MREKPSFVFFIEERTPWLFDLTIGNQRVKSSNQMNVLGLILATSLKWFCQVGNSIRKSNSAKYAMLLLSSFPRPKQTRMDQGAG